MSIDKVKKIIKDNGVKFADLRFADMSGREQHLSIPASTVDDALFEDGKMFDGSSIAGWKGINESDMVLLPDSSTVFLDPFAEESTLVLRCDVLEPSTMQPYSRCPRGIAKRAEAYLKAAGVGDTAFFGPEPEFFIFDSVRSSASINGSFYEIESEQGAWNSGKSYEHGNTGHRPGVKGGYFPTGPVDAFQDLRSAMCLTLEALGIPVEVHHSEVATGGQCEIGTRFNTLVKKSDELLTLKYVVKNIAHQHGHTATFMPKPLVGDNGSGMHVHQSIAKGGKNLFSGNEYGGLSKMALHYIAGVFKHARAVNAFTNSGTNSYKRLVPGFEAPVLLAYSARNRSASCRIPWVSNPKARRIEVRFPDAINSGYLTFTALMMAGLDGIKNKLDPGAPSDKDLYDLPPEEEKLIPTVCHSLDQALEALDADREFLKAGGVMSDDFIDGYIELKMKEVTELRMRTHPVEILQYYSA
jgi:glutamine synthetase